MLYLTNIDLNLNELQNAIIQNLASDPASPVAGQIWYNTTSNQYKFYDGTAVFSYLTQADLTTALADYQTKITATGILKGNGAGGVSAATAGTDYDYAQLSGSSDPTTATEAAGVGQRYINTTDNTEFYCSAIDTSGSTPSYTWTALTTDVSGKQDVITATGILKGEGSGTVSAATAGTDYGYPELTASADPTTATVGAVGQQYLNTTSGQTFVCTAADTSTPSYTWQPIIMVTANKALVSDANGAVSASSVTATELGYLSGVTSNVQSQLDNIPKFNYLEGVDCTVSDGASQSDINTAAIAVISSTYSSPSKWDAVNVAVTFTPSDTVKDAIYYYDGSAWTFLYYSTTGVQLANGTTAGIIAEADAPDFDATQTYNVGDVVKNTGVFYRCINAISTPAAWNASDWEAIAQYSDLTIVNGVATVNQSAKLKTARNITVQGNYASSTDGITATAASFDGSAGATIIVTGIKPEMLSAEVPVSLGGTGKTSITNGNVLVGNASGGFDELGIDTTVTTSSTNLVTSGAVAAAIGGGSVAHKYTEENSALTPSSGLASWIVNHALATTAVTVQVFDVSTGKQVIPEVTITDANNVTIGINASSTIAASTYRVVVFG